MGETREAVETTRELRHGYAGADWLEDGYKVRCSPIGRIAAEIVGFVWGGLYHLPEASLRNASWSDPRHVFVVVPDGLATYDGSQLTLLVLLAHDLGVRLQINEGGPRGLKLMFSPRTLRTGGAVWDRHPTLEDAAAKLRERYIATFAAPAPAGGEG